MCLSSALIHFLLLYKAEYCSAHVLQADTHGAENCVPVILARVMSEEWLFLKKWESVVILVIYLLYLITSQMTDETLLPCVMLGRLTRQTSLFLLSYYDLIKSMT